MNGRSNSTSSVAPQFASSDELERAIKRAFEEKISSIEWLRKQVKHFDPERDEAAMIDELFEVAGSFHRRRLDYALYQFAVMIKSRKSASKIQIVRERILSEIAQTKMHLYRGREAWVA